MASLPVPSFVQAILARIGFDVTAFALSAFAFKEIDNQFHNC